MNDRQQTAVLPAKTLQVQPSALAPPPPAATASPAPGVAPGRAGGGFRDGAGSDYWRWLAMMFAALWLITLALAWRQRGRRRAMAAMPRPDRGGAEAALLRRLQSACKHGDAAAARRALLEWLREFGPGKADGSLLEFAALCGEGALGRSIYALDSAGYRKEPGAAWDGKALWTDFEAWRKAWRASRAAQRPAPTDLYAPANR